MAANKYRSEVIKLYKTLLFMGREYPLGYPYFRERCHRAFSKNSKESDPDKVAKMISHGEFVVKELTSLYYLKKYRTMKRRYYPDDEHLQKMDKMMQDIEKIPEELNK